MTLQTYKPYRASLISREQLRNLSTLRPAVVIRDTIVDWAWVLAAWTLVAWHPAWWTVLIAVLVIGAKYYALKIIAHDGFHRRLFESQHANDLWCDLFLLGPIGAITRLNRRNHIEHHRMSCLPDDPDRHKYVHAGKDTPGKYLLFLTGLGSFVTAARNVFAPKAGRRRDAGGMNADGYRWRDVGIILGWQIALVGGLTWAIGWWAYPVLWVLPVYLFAYLANMLRSFAEHSVMLPEEEADKTLRLITFRSNWLERQFFAPHYMNLHAAHHLWPGIPYYNLPAADRLIHDSPGRTVDLVWRGSYVGYLASYWTEYVRRARAPVVHAGA